MKQHKKSQVKSNENTPLCVCWKKSEEKTGVPIGTRFMFPGEEEFLCVQIFVFE